MKVPPNDGLPLPPADGLPPKALPPKLRSPALPSVPPFGLRPDLGTFPPSSWNDAEFLNLVLAAVQTGD